MISRSHPPGSLRLALGVVVATALGAACWSTRPSVESPPAVPEPRSTVTVRATPLTLDPRDAERRQVGELTVRAVLSLDADDPDFGGFSGLAVEGTDRWLAVSDRGTWWSGRLVFGVDGALAGVDDVTTGALPDVDGRPVAGRFRHDAEEVLAWDPESLMVTFEGNHRLVRLAREHGDGWRPATGQASTELDLPAAVRSLPENGGLEAATRLRDGRLFLAAESPRADGRRRGWVGDLARSRWVEFVYSGPEGFRPTGASLLPDGDVLVVERFYEESVGAQARLVRLAAASLPANDSTSGEPSSIATTELGRFAQPLQVDNFEAVAVILAPAAVSTPGADPARILMLSDDNFSDTQRTLLVHAELP